jgi:pimeloyl-ACP methyl ester carboxylesterase
MSPSVDLPSGMVRYAERGSGPPMLFLHGFLVDGSLWDEVVAELAEERRCVVPDLPLGSHRVAMRRDADLSPPALAGLIDDLMAALGLEDVTLVGNDTGGAICQLVATQQPQRIGRLVLTNCDAFENFLPPAFRYLQVAARLPGGLWPMAKTIRFNAIRRAPIAYGWLTKSRIDNALLDRWTGPIRADAAIRRDAAKLLRGISKRYTLEAGERLREFDRPTLVAWGRNDRFFKPTYAERLAAAIPDSRLEWIDDSAAFVPIDQPGRLAELIGSFA